MGILAHCVYYKQSITQREEQRMKQKLLIALLTAAAVTGLLAGNVAAGATADETWGTGGWNVPKQRTTWNPDGVWMEGEYYNVEDRKSVV